MSDLHGSNDLPTNKLLLLCLRVESQAVCKKLEASCTLLLIGTNGKPLAAIGKFPSAIGKLMISKTLATNGEEITNAMIGNDVLANYW